MEQGGDESHCWKSYKLEYKEKERDWDYLFLNLVSKEGSEFGFLGITGKTARPVEKLM